MRSNTPTTLRLKLVSYSKSIFVLKAVTPIGFFPSSIEIKKFFGSINSKSPIDPVAVSLFFKRIAGREDTTFETIAS